MQIPAKGEYTTDSGARYLNVFSANRTFTISSKNEGLPETTVKSGYSYDLENITNITFHNHGDDDLHLDFEISNLKIVTGSNAGVDIVNTPTIQKIIEPIDFEANVTFDEGTVHVISATGLSDSVDKTINAGLSGELLPANPNRKAALIQVISDNRTAVRIGSSSVAANRGTHAAGSKSNPAMVPIETSAAIHALNVDDTNQATFSVLEILK